MPLQLESVTIDAWPFALIGVAYGQGTRLQLEVYSLTAKLTFHNHKLSIMADLGL